MQNFKVTVNGKVFDVTVEEGQPENVQPISQTYAPVVPVEKAAEPIASPVSALKPGKAEAGDIQVNAPLTGTIMSIKVKSGDPVKYGQVLLTLEALKMENEIVAPGAGTVKDIFAVTGASVNVGDLLVTLTA